MYVCTNICAYGRLTPTLAQLHLFAASFVLIVGVALPMDSLNWFALNSLCFALSCIALSCLTLLCLAWLCFVLFCLALSCFALLCVRPCFVLFCFDLLCIHVTRSVTKLLSLRESRRGTSRLGGSEAWRLRGSVGRSTGDSRVRIFWGFSFF